MLYGMVSIDIYSSVRQISKLSIWSTVIVQFFIVGYSNELLPLCKKTFFTLNF